MTIRVEPIAVILLDRPVTKAFPYTELCFPEESVLVYQTSIMALLLPEEYGTVAVVLPGEKVPVTTDMTELEVSATVPDAAGNVME